MKKLIEANFNFFLTLNDILVVLLFFFMSSQIPKFPLFDMIIMKNIIIKVPNCPLKLVLRFLLLRVFW